MLPDPRTLEPESRNAAAWRIHQSPDFRLPELRYLNSTPCPEHQELVPWCMKCGVRLKRHQRVGAAWMFMDGSCLLADSVGTGKTIQTAAMFAMCKETGELGPDSRAVVVCKAAAVVQWGQQLRRLLPDIPVITASGGDPDARIRGYLGPWEIAVVSDRTFAPAGGSAARGGDVEYLCRFPVGTLVYDDLDPLRNPDTATSRAVVRLAGECERVHGLHGTPLQKRLEELYSFLIPVGGGDAFGSLQRFRRRFVQSSSTYIHIPDKRDPTGRRKILKEITKYGGVKEHMLPEFRDTVAPFVLRRRASDLDDVELPAVMPSTVWVDLLPEQKARYEELRKGVLRRLRESGTEVSTVEAAQAFLRGSQICSGLAALDDGRDVSAKLDWVVDKVTGDLEDEKVVCFVYYTQNVAALSARLTAQGVGHVLMWSPENNAAERQRRIDRFTSDPDCRVLIGTTTIEMSLNLQAAGHLIAVDTIMNPARMEQLVGRVKRQGSRHSTVFFHHLLTPGTQEQAYPVVLGQEQGMADAVWNEDSEIFAQLTPRQVMEMVAHAQPAFLQGAAA